MHTSSQTLEGHKVKLTIEVDEEEIKAAESDTLRRLRREVRLPGFRPGKAPERLLAARLGHKAVREEVLRDALPKYYSDAVEEIDLDVISTPQIDITSGEEEGPVVFDAVVEVRPDVSIAGYEGLEITLDGPEPTEAEVDAQVDRLREQFATLTEVERPARDHDLVTLDVHGTRNGEPAEGLSADDIVYEVGTGGIAEGIDERLFGAKVGDIFEMDAEDAPGGPAHLRVLVKQVREKVLPEANDEFASDASEFETIDELKEDLRKRLSAMKRLQANIDLREKSLEALSELVLEDLPLSLVAHETEHLLEDFVRRLASQRIVLEDYLNATGQDAEQFMNELQEQARRQVRADLALRALARAEGLEVEESDVDEEIVRIANQAGERPATVRSALEQQQGLSGLRSQIKNAKAMEWLLEHISLTDSEGRPIDRAAFRLEDTAEPGGESTDGQSPEGSDEPNEPEEKE